MFWTFISSEYCTIYSASSTQGVALPLTLLTWDLGGELRYDWGAVALGCASAQSEGVCGARVETREHVGGLVAQLHSFPALVGKVQLRVKGAHRLIGDLAKEKKEYSFSCPGNSSFASFLPKI